MVDVEVSLSLRGEVWRPPIWECVQVKRVEVNRVVVDHQSKAS